MANFKGLWQGYTDGNVGVASSKNNPNFLYRNFRGPVPFVVPEPRRLPQVHDRWTADPFSKAFYRACNRWLFCNSKMRAFVLVSLAFATEKFWNWTLGSIVRYNNMECTMEFAYKKEREWREFQEAEYERKKALGLLDDDDEDFDDDEEDEDEDDDE